MLLQSGIRGTDWFRRQLNPYRLSEGSAQPYLVLMYETFFGHNILTSDGASQLSRFFFFFSIPSPETNLYSPWD